MQWDDLAIMRTLGCGSFGRVRLVQNKTTQEPYALKALKKVRVKQMKQEKSIMNEKTALEEMQHQFVLKLVSTFKDKRQLYMLLELVTGGELFTVNANTGPLGEAKAKFYVSQIIIAFEALHRQGWVYRDLKPEVQFLIIFFYFFLERVVNTFNLPRRTFFWTLKGTAKSSISASRSA